MGLEPAFRRSDARKASMEQHDLLSDEPFSYRETKDGRAFIAFRGRVVTTLAGAAARKFLARVAGTSPRQAQLAMAKVTGHFKHGNERSGRDQT